MNISDYSDPALMVLAVLGVLFLAALFLPPRFWRKN